LDDGVLFILSMDGKQSYRSLLIKQVQHFSKPSLVLLHHRVW